MKKIWSLGLSLLLMAGMFAGCSSQKVTAKSLMEAAAKVAKEATSGTMETTLQLDMQYQGETMAESITANMEVVTDPVAMKASANIHYEAGEETSDEGMDIYYVPEDEGWKIYSGDADFWMVEDAEASQMDSIVNDLRIPDLMNDNSDVELTLQDKTEGTDAGEVYVLTGTVTGETLKTLSSALSAIVDMSLEEAALSMKAPVEYRIRKTDSTPAEVRLDLTETMITTSDDFAEVLDAMVLTIDYTGWNSVEAVEVPADVKDNAISMDDMYADAYDDIDWDNLEYDENLDTDYEIEEDVLLTTTDTSIETSHGTLEEPASVGDWITCYTLLSTGEYFQVYLKVNAITRGEAADQAAADYIASAELPSFDGTLDEALEYCLLEYEVYLPEDFPDDTFEGVSMYLVDDEGNYLDNSAYNFVDLFWVEPFDMDNLPQTPGTTGTGRGLFSVEKGSTAYLLQIGDSWGNESYVGE